MFTYQSKDDTNLEAEKSHRRDVSETWAEKFRREAKEIDEEFKLLKKELHQKDLS